MNKPLIPIDPEPGKRLKELRLAAGLTQSQLAAPEYTKAYVSALENGLIRFSVAAGGILAARLGTTVGFLLEGDRVREALIPLASKMADHLIHPEDHAASPMSDPSGDECWTNLYRAILGLEAPEARRA